MARDGGKRVSKAHRPFQGSPKSRALIPRSGRARLPQVYLAQTRRAAESVYQPDHPEARRGSRLKWLASTMLAAGVGIVAIGAALFQSIEGGQSEASMFETIGGAIKKSMVPAQEVATVSLEATRGKADRLAVAERGTTTRFIIKDQVTELKGNKPFLVHKPYARIVAKLSSVAGAPDERIPPFNPFNLYAATAAGGGDAAQASPAGTMVVARRDAELTEIAVEDGLSFSDAEILKIAIAEREGSLGGVMADGGGSLEAGDEGEAETEPGSAPPASAAAPLPPNTIAIAKSETGDEQRPQFQGQEVRVLQAGAKDTLTTILQRNGVDAWHSKAIVAAARKVVDGEGLGLDQEVRLVMAPAGTGEMQPALVTVFTDAHSHLVTVARTASGGYAGSENPLAANFKDQLQDQQNGRANSSLYTALFTQTLQQGLPAPMIQRLIRTFAYDTDFRRRVGPGDAFEAFYDIAEDPQATGADAAKPKELLYAALTVGGQTRKFYRFRTPDGQVDFYDADGNNAKKFLTVKPVRGDVRYTSGYGLRLHPILKVRKPHTGVDWAGTPGTPILAAGNGVIAEIGRKGGNGNYIRIRHANGYETAYSHMQRFVPGLALGSKVNQGDQIGYLGTSGLSSGPHLHFEVLVNSSFVDPMTIHVPRERQLSGKQQTEFAKERARIDDLMTRQPVTSFVDQVASKG